MKKALTFLIAIAVAGAVLAADATTQPTTRPDVPPAVFNPPPVTLSSDPMTGQFLESLIEFHATTMQNPSLANFNAIMARIRANIPDDASKVRFDGLVARFQAKLTDNFGNTDLGTALLRFQATPVLFSPLAKFDATPVTLNGLPASFNPNDPNFQALVAAFQNSAATLQPVLPTELNVNARTMAAYFPAMWNRDISRSPSFLPTNAVRLDKWKTVYAAEYAPIAHVDLPTGLKIISEVRVPQNDNEYTNFTQELDYFAGKGYNAVLLCWFLEDDAHGFDRVVTYAKGKSMKVLFTYGGSFVGDVDRYSIDPADYQAGLQYLAGKCDGFLLGWKQTNIGPNFKPDSKWVDYTLTSIRGANANAFILGGYHFYNSDPRGDIFKYIPDNSSGVAAFNLGVTTVNVSYAWDKLLKPLNQPVIVQIVGERYFYNSLRPTHRTKAENRKLIELIENKYVKAGASGILTEAGDMSDDVVGADKLGTSNLCKTAWSKP